MSTTRTRLLFSVCLAATLVLRPAAQTGAACPRCGWRPPAAERTVLVKNVGELERALQPDRAKRGDTILLAEGTYALTRMLDVVTPGVTIRSRSGDPATTILRGGGMVNDPIGVALSIGAPDVTVADITIRDVGYHAVQVRGERGASRFTLHNARLLDTGQQLLKGSSGGGPEFADDGLVACSTFSYTTNAPTNYTDGVDILGTKGWQIRDNAFARIRGPESGRWSAGPAILAWWASEDTIVERNLIVDSFRGIALGLMPGEHTSRRNGQGRYDHVGGVIRQNVIVNLTSWADEAIEANLAKDVRIEHNTVMVEGVMPWSIGIRFPVSTAVVRNNLTNKRIFERDGGHAVMEGNVTTADRTWFVDAPGNNLQLSPGGTGAIDAGVPIPEISQDYQRRPRVVGTRPDAGAYEADKVMKAPSAHRERHGG